MRSELVWKQLGEMGRLFAIGGVTHQEKVGLAGWLERLLHELGQLLEVLLETIAITIVAIALVIALKRLFHHRVKGKSHHLQEQIRLEFGQTLALSLEFQLAADIVATAVSPTWEDLGKLGIIAGIRTFLNFFLQREVQELQDIMQDSQPDSQLEADRLT